MSFKSNDGHMNKTLNYKFSEKYDKTLKSNSIKQILQPKKKDETRDKPTKNNKYPKIIKFSYYYEIEKKNKINNFIYIRFKEFVRGKNGGQLEIKISSSSTKKNYLLKNKNNNTYIYIIVGGVIFIIILIIVCVCVGKYYYNSKQQSILENDYKSSFKNDDFVPPSYSVN